jgi:hypothetical protein
VRKIPEAGKGVTVWILDHEFIRALLSLCAPVSKEACMKNIPGLLLVACAVLICGCARSTDYFPLSSGAQWEYSVDYTGFFGNPQKGKIVTRIEGTEVINGKTYYKVATVSSGIPGGENRSKYYRRGDDGIYEFDGTNEHLFLPFPLEDGRTWTVNEGNKQWTFRVEGRETAHLITKKYDDCVKITFEMVQTTDTIFGAARDRMSGVTYRAQGIGEVKVIVNGQNGKAEVSLESYTQ